MFTKIVAGAVTATLLPVLAAPAAAAAAVSTISLVAAARPISQLQIEVVGANGSGCPTSNTTADVLTFGTETFALTLTPDRAATDPDFVARTGNGTTASDSRRNCQYTLMITPPTGMTYAVAEADFSGSVSLPRDAEAVVRTSYYFQGSQTTRAVSHTLSGPRAGSWQATDTVNTESRLWAPCGQQRALNINSEVRVSADAGVPSQITMGNVSVFRLAWKSC